MTTVSQPDTEELIERTARGDAEARQELLVRHRKKLVKMVAVRLDRGVAARRHDKPDADQRQEGDKREERPVVHCSSLPALTGEPDTR